MEVIAILCADLHLTSKVPLCRNEESWYPVMKRVFGEIQCLVTEHNCSILCAGDVFDSWLVSPELVNWVIEHIPRPFFSICGQHDLAYHSIDQISKSAYKTLCLAGAINNVSIVNDSDKFICGFPWTKDKNVRKITGDNATRIALIHRFVWVNERNKHKQADDSSFYRMVIEDYPGFNVLVFGDNHKGFVVKHNDVVICNCGTLFRRKRDEKEYKPFVGFLYEDNSIEKHYLDISKDEFVDDIEYEETEERIDCGTLVSEYKDLGCDSLDFRMLVNEVIEQRKTKQEIVKLVLRAMENATD